MNIIIFERLYREGLLTDSSMEKIRNESRHSLISVHWELRLILYLGILLLTGGLGILIYKNFDQLSHTVIVMSIAAICAGCYFYCFKKRLAFSFNKVLPPNAFFDYVLLLGCITFVTLIAYLQFQYNIFGTRYGLATLIPALLLFFTTYYFDHIGVLSLAIVNFAAWVGISITPLHLLEQNNFNSSHIILTSMALGILLIAVAGLSRKKNIKAHFHFTYLNFGMHILFVALLASFFEFEPVYLLCFLVLAAAGFYFYKYALAEKSFYVLLVITLYCYIGLSYVMVRLLDTISSDGMALVYLGFFYFIGSGVGMILFLMKHNKMISKK